MALDSQRAAEAVVAAIAGKNDEVVGAEKEKLICFWKLAIEAIFSEIKTNGDIELESGDIPINPGTFVDGSSQSITGQGSSATTTIQGRIN